MTTKLWRRFVEDDSGAVTVDWVVLTAGLIAFGVLVSTAIITGANDTATGMGAKLSSADVPTVSFQ